MLRVVVLAATTGASLLLVPLLVHSLGDRTYGLWSLATTFIGYYSLLELGLGGAVTRHVAAAIGARDEREANRLYATSLLVYCGLGTVIMLLSVVAAVVCGFFIPRPDDAVPFRYLILLLGGTVACTFPIRVLMGVLNAHLRFDLTATVDLVTVVVRTALMLGVVYFKLGIVALGWATLLASVPSWLLNYLFVRRTLPFLHFHRGLFHSDSARILFSYASVSFVAQMADLLRFQVDAFVVAGFIGLAAVTHYNIAGSLAQYFVSLMIASMGILGPLFSQRESENDPAKMKATFFFGTKVGIVLATFVGWGLIAWGRPFIERWMGRPYLDAYPPLVALALGCTFALWQIASLQLLYGISRHRIYAVFNSLEGVANLVVSLALVRRYGLLGVALGTCIPMAITKLFIQPVYTCRVLSVPLATYVRAFARTLLCAVLALVVPTLLTVRWQAPSYPRLIVIGAISGILYAAVVWLLDFHGDDADIVKRAILPKFALAKSSYQK